jgi:hypothetical protein
LIIPKFHCAIAYTPECAFNFFADEVSDARCTEEIDTAYQLIAETMKLVGYSAYGKTITNKEKHNSTNYGNHHRCKQTLTKHANTPVPLCRAINQNFVSSRWN